MKNGKYKKDIGILIIISILSGTLLSGCINSIENLVVLPGFTVHEWGVFVSEYNCNFTYVLTKPIEGPIYVRKPIIYFHYDGNISNLAINITCDGDCIVTIPEALNSTSGFGWTVDVMNNSVIAPNGTVYDFLFYECQISYTQDIIAHILDDGINVTFYIKNIGDCDIENIFYIYGYPNNKLFWGNEITYIIIDSLKIGEEKTISVTLENNTSSDKSEMTDLLIEKGLTIEEAEELVDYWYPIWFRPTNIGGFSHIVYMFPQYVYDQLFPIDIVPKPEYINRVGLFFITDIPINPTHNNLKVTLDIEKNTYYLCKSVKGNLSFTNLGRDEANISLYSIIEVENDNNETIFQDFINFNEYFHINNFPPYSGEELNIYWNQIDNQGNQVKPGFYTIKSGVITDNNQIIFAPSVKIQIIY